ncbi:MAG TPA: glycosyltransferase [Elusimicrobiota bacterium]|nr:glycosyltransferase [Elusimicrobiota bacterium]
MNRLTASLVIPTYNRSDVLRETIERAIEQDYPGLEILVVDQTASHPAALEQFLTSEHSAFRYLRLPKPSVTAARNVGIRQTRGDVLVFVDDDVRIEPDFVRSIVSDFDAPAVGGVMGLLCAAGPSSEAESLAEATRMMLAAAPIKADSVVEVEWLSNSAVAYRRKVLLDAGLFDEYFIRSAWCEDADMSVRVHALGYRLLLDARLPVSHLYWRHGGCGNREPGREEEIEQDHMDFFHYFILKNRKFFGSRKVVRSLYQQYRRYVLNRSTMARGLQDLWRRHRRFGQSLAAAMRNVPPRQAA